MTALFDRVALIGIGLIGSSLARRIRQRRAREHIAASARSAATLATVRALKLADTVTADPAEAVRGADLVVICTPMGAYEEVAKAIAPALKPGAIVSDVGSVKRAAIDDAGAASAQERAFGAGPSGGGDRAFRSRGGLRRRCSKGIGRS